LLLFVFDPGLRRRATSARTGVPVSSCGRTGNEHVARSASASSTEQAASRTGASAQRAALRRGNGRAGVPSGQRRLANGFSLSTMTAYAAQRPSLGPPVPA
jgi:hypothetical protein